MIQVIVRAIDILEYVASHDKEPVQLFKIAEHVGLSNPTTANIVKTLLEKNFLEQMGRKKGYRLGIAAFHLTGNPSYQENLINASKDVMENLTKQLEETSLLAMVQNNKRIILHQVECNQVLQVRTVMEADLYDTSTGKLLMAYFTPTELNKFINTIGLPSKQVWPGAETRAGLEKMLKKIRDEEFTITYSKFHTVGFAVPIFKDNIAIAGLSIFVPESRYVDQHKEKIAKLIRKAAKQISSRL